MPGLSGTEIKCAVKKASVWGTAVACGANNGILLLPTSIKRDADIFTDGSMGIPYTKEGIPGPVKVEGDKPAYLRYDGLDLLFAMYMGTAGAPTLQGSGAYAFTYKVKQLLDGLFFSYAQNMKNYIAEYPSVKCVGITIKGEVGAKPLEVTFQVIINDKVVNSAINTTATFANVTFFEELNSVRFSEGVYRMNAQSGAALAGGDTIYPAAFDFTSKRKDKGEYSTKYKTATNQELIDEPASDGSMDTTLKLTFPRHVASTYIADVISDARKKLDMTFTGALIGGSYYRQFKLQFPNLQLKNVDPVDAQGNIKEPLEFIVHGCLTAPSGMTGLTDPFWISGINRLSTDPLA